MSKKGMKYDYKEAYNKNLKPSARLHYLENARHDKDSSSPYKFLGANIASIAAGIGRGNFVGTPNGRLMDFYQNAEAQRIGSQQTTQAKQSAAAIAAGIGGINSATTPVAPTTDMSAGAVASGGAMDPTNPFAGKTFKIEPTSPMGMVGTDASQTFQPPMASNEIGGAKDLFGDKTRGMAQTIYGTQEQRQISVKSPYTMKSIPEGDKGAGLRALPDNVVENMGYDPVTKMVSPLNDNHPGNKKMLKTLTDKPKVTTAYNSSYAGNPNVSNRVYNAATGLTINEDPTYNYKKASQYEANAIQQHGSLEAARKALYNKRNK